MCCVDTNTLKGRNLLKGLNTFLSAGTLSTFIVGAEIRPIYKKYADYGLDGPGSNPGGYEAFHPSRRTLGPTQLPVQCVPVLYQG